MRCLGSVENTSCKCPNCKYYITIDWLKTLIYMKSSSDGKSVKTIDSSLHKPMLKAEIPIKWYILLKAPHNISSPINSKIQSSNLNLQIDCLPIKIQMNWIDWKKSKIYPRLKLEWFLFFPTATYAQILNSPLNLRLKSYILIPKADFKSKTNLNP